MISFLCIRIDLSTPGRGDTLINWDVQKLYHPDPYISILVGNTVTQYSIVHNHYPVITYTFILFPLLSAEKVLLFTVLVIASLACTHVFIPMFLFVVCSTTLDESHICKHSWFHENPWNTSSS